MYQVCLGSRDTMMNKRENPCLHGGYILMGRQSRNKTSKKIHYVLDDHGVMEKPEHEVR